MSSRVRSFHSTPRLSDPHLRHFDVFFFDITTKKGFNLKAILYQRMRGQRVTADINFVCQRSLTFFQDKQTRQRDLFPFSHNGLFKYINDLLLVVQILPPYLCLNLHLQSESGNCHIHDKFFTCILDVLLKEKELFLLLENYNIEKRILIWK